MKAKKFLAMLIACAAMFSLTACGSSGSSSTAGSDNSGDQNAEVTANWSDGLYDNIRSWIS